jgi:hypothetical protein
MYKSPGEPIMLHLTTMSPLEQFKQKINFAAKSQHTVLKEKLELCIQDVEDNKQKYLSTKKELVSIETNLINAKESKIRAEQELYEYESTYVIESSLEDEKDLEVEAYKKRMPELMAKIKDERPIPFKTISELGS